MASRDIGGPLHAALRDLFDERAVVEEAIHKLQSLLEGMKESVRRSLPSGRKAKPAPVKKKTTAKKKGKKVAAAKPAARGKKKASARAPAKKKKAPASRRKKG